MSTIVEFGYPILRACSREIASFDRELRRLLETMGKVLSSRRDGAALAAPQIGRSVRVFVMDYEGVFLEAINPVVTPLGDEIVVGPEGCLSLPGMSGNVPRHRSIRIEYKDRQGVVHAEEHFDEVARCIQHETDHLDGILFVDRMQEDVLTRNRDGSIVRRSAIRT